MKTSDFYFDLPERLIAQTPIPDRAASKLLVLDKKTGGVRHEVFRSLAEFINPGDCLVLNETKVIPARLIGVRAGTGARVEFLLLKRLDEKRWEILVNPGKKARPGDEIHFGGGELCAVIEHVTETGNRIARFEFDGIFEQKLNALGDMPLPPYIKQKLDDGQRYQTVYAKHEGSAAAPTAGLHFTEQILEELSGRGVKIARLTLHVGLGTFRPVKVEEISEHHMHSEFYSIEPEQAKLINSAKASGGRIIAVGTTSCRTLESCAVNGEIVPGSGWTDIFIYPGYEFKITDGIITNFHLPESTLIMLISALAGRDAVLNAYAEAVMREYRFFSFGDAMLIV